MFLKGVYTLIMKAELSKIEDIAKCSVCVGFNIRKASRAISQYYESVLKPSGIRGTQFSLLANIRSAGKPTINELAEALVMDRTTLTRNLQALEKQGLVKIGEGTDRRTRNVSLTGKGIKHLTEAIPYWEKAQEHMIKHLGAEQWDDLRMILGKLVQSAKTG